MTSSQLSSMSVELKRLTLKLGDRFHISEDFFNFAPNDEVLFMNSMLRAALEDDDESDEALAWQRDIFTSASTTPPTSFSDNDGAPRPSQSRYPPGIEAILRSPERDSHGSKFKERFSLPRSSGTHTQEIPWDETIFSRPAQRVPSPPRSPRAVSPAHFLQSPNGWDLQSSRESVDTWRSEFSRLRVELKHGLLPYFSSWFPPSQARRLIRAYGRLARELAKLLAAVQELHETSSTLPVEVAARIEAIDRDLHPCKDRAEGIYDRATRKNASATGPLQGKERCWRKFHIQFTMAPGMQSLRKDLDEIRGRVRGARRALRVSMEGGRDGNATSVFHDIFALAF